MFPHVRASSGLTLAVACAALVMACSLDPSGTGVQPSGGGASGTSSTTGGGASTTSSGDPQSSSSAGGGSTTGGGQGGAGGVGGAGGTGGTGGVGGGGGGGPTPTCGDGTVNVIGEQCDDGNVTSGDGCSATCGYELSGTCPQATLVLGEDVVSFSGDTFSGTATYSGSCGGVSAREYIFKITPIVSGTLAANLTGNFDDTNVKVLWLHAACPPTSGSLACVTGTISAALTYPVTAGGVYYLGVDGESDSEGPFNLVLNVTVP